MHLPGSAWSVAPAGGGGPDYSGVQRNLALELVRVTEAAALAGGRWLGKGDKNAADQVRYVCSGSRQRCPCAVSGLSLSTKTVRYKAQLAAGRCCLSWLTLLHGIYVQAKGPSACPAWRPWPLVPSAAQTEQC